VITGGGWGRGCPSVNRERVCLEEREVGKEGPMAKMMTKSQVAGYIAGKFGLTKKQGTAILEELANLAAKQARNGFVFPGVGKLVVVKRKARMGRNPQTGEPIKIPAKTVLKFRIAKAMKELALK